MKYSEKEINDIVNLRDGFDHQLNIFELKGDIRVFDKNPKNGYNSLISENVNANLADFEECTTEQEVKDTFNDNLTESIKVNLVKFLGRLLYP